MVALEAFSAAPAFVRSPRTRSFALKTAADDQVNDIKKEFSDLQHKLFNELEAKKVSSQHGVVEAEEIAEEMIEKAIKITGAMRDVNTEHMASAEKELKHALENEELSEEMMAQAHKDSEAAMKQTLMLETMEDGYESMERLRDMSVAHAAHHVEEDAKSLYTAAKHEEEHAKSILDDASDTLAALEKNEADLKTALQGLRSLKREKDSAEWRKDKSE
eukprot:scaffold36394_cov54-Attheya_sp.AAC.2